LNKLLEEVTGRNPWRMLNPNKAAAAEFLRDGAMEERGGVAASGDEDRRHACFCCKYRGRGTEAAVHAWPRAFASNVSIGRP